MSQKTINLHTSQVSHGEASIVNDVASVVVGYTPSMIRANLHTDAAFHCKLYWYATDPDHVIYISDTTGTTGYGVADSPIVVNERGFVFTVDVTKALFDSGGPAEDTEGFTWETFGSMEGASIGPDGGKTYNMPGEPGTYSVYGVVHIAADQINGAIVNIFSGDELVGYDVTEADGKYEIPNVPNGSYTLIVVHGDYDLETVSITVNGEDLEENVEMQSSVDVVYTVSGTITDGDGNVEGALVVLTAEGVVSGAAITDGSGEYTTTGVASGSYVLHVSKEGYQDHSSEPFSITGDVTGKDVQLEAVAE